MMGGTCGLALEPVANFRPSGNNAHRQYVEVSFAFLFYFAEPNDTGLWKC